MALIRDNGIICEAIIHGSLSRRIPGFVDALALRYTCAIEQRLLEIIGALSALSSRS